MKFKHLNRSRLLKAILWRARRTLRIKPSYDAEIIYWLERLQKQSHNAQARVFDFPWGRVEYVLAGQLNAQYREIFIGRQYAFTCANQSPIIIDCGGNIGISAIWFRLNYPNCVLTVYEADPDLADMARRNLRAAGLGDTLVRNESVWIRNECVSFEKKGDDSGRISKTGQKSYPAIDFAETLPAKVDLLKMDIEGAEYEVLDHLCRSRAIQRIQNLVCEFHVWRDKTDKFIETLNLLRKSGFQISLEAKIGTWIGDAKTVSPFEVVQCKQGLVEVFAWR